MVFTSRGRPNVSRLARRGKVDDLRAALQYDEPAVRAEAAAALAQFGDPEVARDLAAALADPEPDVRLAALGSLEAVGVHDYAQVDRLIECVVGRGERAPELTAGALRLIVAAVPQQSAELLVDRLVDVESPPPDQGHRASLDLLLTADTRGDAARDDVVDLLIQRLEYSADGASEGRAETMLRWLGDAGREKVLHALENGTATPGVMQAAGRLGDARAIGPVVKGLQDPDAEMREAAAHAARALNHTRAVPALLTATQDDEQSVRDAASAALDRMGTAAVIAGLAAVVDARALLEAGPPEDLTGEALGAKVAEALEAGAEEAEPGTPPTETGTELRSVPDPAGGGAPSRAVAPAVPPRRRGGLLDRLFGRYDY